MFRLPYVIGALALAAALVVGTGSQGQDKGDEPKKGDDPKKAVQLPAGWGKIGLTPDQKKKVLAVRSTYVNKIEELRKQIDHLKTEEYAEMYKLLNDDQKATLKKNADKDPDKGADKGGDKSDAKKDPAKVDRKDPPPTDAKKD
jgi:hypothetical protein